MFPIVRLRRNRRTSWLRDLMAESTLRPEDLILPMFVVEGENERQFSFAHLYSKTWRVLAYAGSMG
ncbi:MAG: hypothetical protein EBY20_06770, partial [Alphaproteobacteria bacterium]|nr:hypothetical protein [Alphaproteobacteria bacterium]NDE19193.1 hypothetical protein [Alphaproteobacteria bacterium]